MLTLSLVKGKNYEIMSDDYFKITIFQDEEELPAVKVWLILCMTHNYDSFKEIKWDKQQGGIPFPQNDVLPGDQILSITRG